jgi:hypothetical protein
MQSVTIKGFTIEEVHGWAQRVEPKAGTQIYNLGETGSEMWSEQMPKEKVKTGIYLGKNLVAIESDPSILAATATKLRQIASRIHCPDSEGGKYAAGIKAEIEAVADSL